MVYGMVWHGIYRGAPGSAWWSATFSRKGTASSCRQLSFDSAVACKITIHALKWVRALKGSALTRHDCIQIFWVFQEAFGCLLLLRGRIQRLFADNRLVSHGHGGDGEPLKGRQRCFSDQERDRLHMRGNRHHLRWGKQGERME